MEYSVNHFINKFENIPEKKWCVGAFLNTNSQSCALGHCGAEYGSSLMGEARALYYLFKNSGLNIYTINDFETKKYPQATPDKRILAALHDVKANQAVKEVEDILKMEYDLQSIQ